MISRKGQTEMIGLLIIVILIAIGMVFYVKFTMTNTRPNLELQSLNLQRAVFTAGAISKVEICGNYSLEKAAALCDSGNARICEGKGACDVIKEKMPAIIKSVLGAEYEVAGESKDAIQGKMFAFDVKSGEKSIARAGECSLKNRIVGSSYFKSEITKKEYTVDYMIC